MAFYRRGNSFWLLSVSGLVICRKYPLLEMMTYLLYHRTYIACLGLWVRAI